MSKEFKIHHPEYMADDEIKVITARNADDAADKYCEYLFQQDPRHIDTVIYVDCMKYSIWIESEPIFCSRRIKS